LLGAYAFGFRHVYFDDNPCGAYGLPGDMFGMRDWCYMKTATQRSIGENVVDDDGKKVFLLRDDFGRKSYFFTEAQVKAMSLMLNDIVLQYFEANMLLPNSATGNLNPLFEGNLSRNSLVSLEEFNSPTRNSVVAKLKELYENTTEHSSFQYFSASVYLTLAGGTPLVEVK
jgi:hypothetical protein